MLFCITLRVDQVCDKKSGYFTWYYAYALPNKYGRSESEIAEGPGKLSLQTGDYFELKKAKLKQLRCAGIMIWVTRLICGICRLLFSISLPHSLVKTALV